MKKGFTLVELLIVIGIIGVLAYTMLPAFRLVQEKATVSRVLAEFKSMNTALELYKDANGGNYPADVSRSIPPGLGAYLAGQNVATWPNAPWVGSVYDWDNWDDPDNPGQKIYQISIRFCPPSGTLATCQFPNEKWAANFGVNSAAYYCVAGKCRAHQGEVYNYPGYCFNCEVQPSAN